ncbi:hypothetical protein AB0H00_19185 [Nocardia sp. NPDC023852]|uniref:hypothetical protein n=1 Tax=Nocardia sp. NPDC023852 TaxID=3154697 RepID=UPI0033DFB0ED
MILASPRRRQDHPRRRALADIADQYGTATYVLDEEVVVVVVRSRCGAYRKAFPEAEIIYAGTTL